MPATPLRALRIAAALLPLALWAGGGARAAEPAPAPPTSVPADPASADPVARGAYVFQAAGCFGCHTDEKAGGKPLAGGRALKTPFGTFFTPNITPDPQTGIGRWSDADFIRAFREGVRPDGAALFPAFPYTSYTRMTDQDLRDLKAYLFAQAPVSRPNTPHDLRAPFGWRFLLPVWQAMHLEEGPRPADPSRPAEWNRGRYLTEALGHCGECHTPRNALGALELSRAYAGTPDGPEGDKVPNLTPAKEMADWSLADVESFLEIGMLPDGDFAGGSMAEVIRNSTSRLTKADRHAIAVYLKSLPPAQ